MSKEKTNKFMKELNKDQKIDELLQISKEEFNNTKKEAVKWIKWGEKKDHKYLPFYYSENDYANVKPDGSDQIKYYLNRINKQFYKENNKIMVSKMLYNELKELIYCMEKNKKDIISKKEPKHYGMNYSDKDLEELSQMAIKEDSNYFPY